MPDAAQDVLAPLQIPDNVKADAWDAYHAASSHMDLTPKLMAVKGLPDSAKADLWDAKLAEVKQTAATSGTQFTQQNSMPTAYGFTPSNIVKNVAQFGQGIASMAKDVLNPAMPLIQGKQGLLGPDTLLGKYGFQPAAAQAKRGQQEVAQGNLISGYTNQALARVPIIGPMLGTIGEQAGQGDIGGAATQVALNVAAQKAASKIGGLIKSTEPSTVGMRQGGVPATVERLVNRIPGSSAPLKAIYNQVADSWRSTVSEGVQKAAGITGEPSDPVGSLRAGSKAIETQAKVAYQPVNDYIKNNNSQLVATALKTIKAAGRQSGLTNEFYENPIAVMKEAIQTEFRKANQGGPEAIFHIKNAENLQTKFGQIMDNLPPEVKASQTAGDTLWAKKSAMKDIADTFDKSVEGLPPDKQPGGLAKLPQPIKAASLLENLKSEPRLRQAFGPNVADAIVQHTARLASAQAMQGGGGGIVGGLYGTSLLARAAASPFVGGAAIATIPAELGGLWALSKVLASPASHPFYANMLRATSLAEQDHWAKMAMTTAMQKQEKK